MKKNINYAGVLSLVLLSTTPCISGVDVSVTESEATIAPKARIKTWEQHVEAQFAKESLYWKTIYPESFTIKFVEDAAPATSWWGSISNGLRTAGNGISSGWAYTAPILGEGLRTVGNGISSGCSYAAPIVGKGLRTAGNGLYSGCSYAASGVGKGLKVVGNGGLHVWNTVTCTDDPYTKSGFNLHNISAWAWQEANVELTKAGIQGQLGEGQIFSLTSAILYGTFSWGTWGTGHILDKASRLVAWGVGR